MAVFRFKMQNILNLKYRLEEQQKIAFAEAQNALYTEEERLAKLEADKASYEEKLKEAALGDIDITDIRRLTSNIDTMKILIEDQKLRIEKAEEEVEKQRELLADAVKERKTYEKLREKAFDRFVKEEEAKEKAAIDELVSYQFTTGALGNGGIAYGEE